MKQSYDKTSCSGGGQASQAAVMNGVWASVVAFPVTWLATIVVV